jgi:hypothetical protein
MDILALLFLVTLAVGFVRSRRTFARVTGFVIIGASVVWAALLLCAPFLTP